MSSRAFTIPSHNEKNIRLLSLFLVTFRLRCNAIVGVNMYVTRAAQYRGHLSFRLFLYAVSLNYLPSIGILKISLFRVWNVFLLYCCFFGWQGRGHNTLFHTVFDVILVQLNEWIPVSLKCRSKSALF